LKILHSFNSKEDVQNNSFPWMTYAGDGPTTRNQRPGGPAGEEPSKGNGPKNCPEFNAGNIELRKVLFL
jgi:hypothetical protein